MAVKLFALKGFFEIYTLQVGVATYCAWGLGLMTISVIVNFSNIVTSSANPEDDYDETLDESGSHFAVFFLFLTLGYVTYFSAMAGAYQEKIYHMKIAIGFLCAQGVMWLLLTLLSFVDVKQVSRFLCVESVRCADRFFITKPNWRYSENGPEYFWNFRPSLDDGRAFRTREGCLNYCREIEEENVEGISRSSNSQ